MSGRLHITTQHVDYLIDTNKKQFQRVVRKATHGATTGWRDYHEFFIRQEAGLLHLTLKADRLVLNSSPIITVEEVE